MNIEPSEEKAAITKVAIVGCGQGGAAVLDIISEDPEIRIEWVAEKNKSAVGVKKAEKMGIPVVDDYRTALDDGLDIIINLTGSQSIGDDLKAIKAPHTELMGGSSAKFMWKLADERIKRKAERERVLKEHESLYHLGVIIENIDNLEDAGHAILDYASKTLDMPSGSIAVFDEKTEEMRMVACRGFSEKFSKINRWEIRKGGLTSTIFNQSSPLFIQNLSKSSAPNPLLIKEGVKSLIAAPLTVDGKIVGILYMNDFKERIMTAEEISIFSLLTVYSSLTIDRAKSIETMRRMSMVDGLTDLFNHRHIMDVMKVEHERATRYNKQFSVIMLDIDNFKAYNDTYGHLEGNRVLKDVSRIFRNTARAVDTVGRFGGEEFCILAPELDREQVSLFANRLQNEISKHSFPNRKVTVSGGTATFPEDGNNIHDLMERADKRLYKAKEAGRDRIYSMD